MLETHECWRALLLHFSKHPVYFEMIGSNLGVKSLELSENRIGCRVWVKRDPHIRPVLDNSF